MDGLQNLREELENFDFDVKDERMLYKFDEIRALQKMDIDEVVEEWIAFAMKEGVTEVTELSLDQFETKLSSRSSNRADIVTPRQQVKTSVFLTTDNIDGSVRLDEDLMGNYATPAERQWLKEHKESLATTTPSRTHYSKPHINGQTPMKTEDVDESLLEVVTMETPVQSSYKDRKNSGQVIASLGGEGGSPNGPVNLAIAPSWERDEKGIKFQYMYQTGRSKSHALNERIVNVSSSLLSYYNLDDPVSLCIPSQEPSIYVGRIWLDTEEGKLHAESAQLEGCMEVSNGEIVKLDLSEAGSFSIFPGQTVVVEGVNARGGNLKVLNMYHDLPLEPRVRANKGSDGFTLLVASGPFTTSDNFKYEPLMDLLQVVKRDKPSVLVLCGPFVDARHNEIENWCYEEDPSKWFDSFLSHTLEVAIEAQTRVVLIPSQNDFHHHQLYPQPPFSDEFKHPYRREANIDERLNFATDPSILTINNVTIGVTSTDILKHLSGQTYTAGPTADRMTTLVQHMYSQRSFYPLFPTHESINMEVESCNDKAKIPFQPDVVILPSELKPFAKLIQGSVCVNPGLLVKGTSGGSFAKVFCPPTDNMNDYSVRITSRVIRI